MKIKDDRTPAQKQTHDWLVVGSDRAMSRWGERAFGQPGFKSAAAWACTYDDLSTVEDWVRGRKDMRYVRVVKAKGYRPKGTGECHIYVVDDAHPAVARKREYAKEMDAAMNIAAEMVASGCPAIPYIC